MGSQMTLVRLHVKVTVDDDRMSFDFSESDAQVRGPINATPWTVWAGVNFAVQGITGASVPINEGVYRPLEVFIPKGCWLNARHPAPRQHSTHETGHRVVDCVLGALAKAVPDRVPAALHGTSSIMIMTGDDGRVAPPEHFMFFECVAGGFGGRPTMDGIDGIRTGMGNAINVSDRIRRSRVLFGHGKVRVRNRQRKAQGSIAADADCKGS